MRPQSSLARSLVSAVLTATVAAMLGGCQTASMSDITGSISGKKSEAAETDPRRAVDGYGERYRANPKNPEAALRYGQALRATGQRAQAVAVLEQASIANPGNKLVLAGYGRALADHGQFQRAFDVLNSAHSPDNPDWRILSVQGTALDQLGRHDEARNYYHSALKIVPEEPIGIVESRDVLRAVEGIVESRGRAAPGLCQAECRSAGAPESRAGRWVAGPVW